MTLSHGDASVYAWHVREVERWRVMAVNEQKRAERDRSHHQNLVCRPFYPQQNARSRYTRARNLVDRWLAADAAFRAFLKSRPKETPHGVSTVHS